MLRLPRTATAGAAKNDRLAAVGQSGHADPPASPTAVLGQPLRRARSSKASQRGWTTDQPAPEGHAQDVLHLLNAGWFGPLSRPKAAASAVLPFDESDEEPVPAPSRRRTAQHWQHKNGNVGAAPSGHGASDGSPTSGSTSQHSGDGSVDNLAALGRRRAAARAAQPSLSRPILTERQRDAAAAAAIQDLPGIGTWAGRYRLFGGKDQAAQQHSEQQPDGQQEPDGQQQQQPEEQQQPQPARAGSFGSFVVLRPNGFAGVGGPAAEQATPPRHRAVYGSEQAQEEAWRWRFGRKWATEQQRFYGDPEPGQPASLVSDDLEAMAFTQACGTGVNLQVMPNSALRPSALGASTGDECHLGLEGSASQLSLCLFDVDASYLSAGPLSATMSPGGSAHGGRGAGTALRLHRAGSGGMGRGSGATPSPRGPSATQTVLSMATRARDLLQKQGAIEAEVQDRWERTRSAGGGGWVGSSLLPVRIDMLGRFKYCVLRVSDGAGHTRFLVRGRAHTEPTALRDAVRQEAASISRTEGLPAAAVEIVGGGMMEWREDTERELYVQPSAVVGRDVQAADSDSPTKTPYLGDMCGLTASLVRQAVPCHFRITTSGASRSASGSIAANRI